MLQTVGGVSYGYHEWLSGLNGWKKGHTHCTQGWCYCSYPASTDTMWWDTIVILKCMAFLHFYYRQILCLSKPSPVLIITPDPPIYLFSTHSHSNINPQFLKVKWVNGDNGLKACDDALCSLWLDRPLLLTLIQICIRTQGVISLWFFFTLSLFVFLSGSNHTRSISLHQQDDSPQHLLWNVHYISHWRFCGVNALQQWLYYHSSLSQYLVLVSMVYVATLSSLLGTHH